MKRKAVLFDLDGTLWDRDAAVRALLARQHACFLDDLQTIEEADYIREIFVTFVPFVV